MIANKQPKKVPADKGVRHRNISGFGCGRTTKKIYCGLQSWYSIYE